VDEETLCRRCESLLHHLLWPTPRTGEAAPRFLLATDLRLEFAQWIEKLLTHTTVIYIVRNGIEVVSSILAHPKYLNNWAFKDICKLWATASEVVEWGKNRDDFLVLRHENLLQRETAETAYRRIFDMLPVEYDKVCVEYVFTERPDPTRMAGEAERVSDDLKKRKERWRLWTDRQRDTFAEICGEAMRYFDYEMPWTT